MSAASRRPPTRGPVASSAPTRRSATASPPGANRSTPSAGPTCSPPGMRRVNPELRYENLAVDGATSAEVLELQVEPGLALEPDFVTVDLRRQRRAAGDPARRRRLREALRRDPAPAARGRAGGDAGDRDGAGGLAVHGPAAAHRSAADRGDEGAERRHPGGGGALRRALPAGRRPPGAARSGYVLRRRAAPVERGPPDGRARIGRVPERALRHRVRRWERRES